MTTAISAWVKQTPHDARRSVDLVRVAMAILLVLHPLHALIHPDDVRELARGLDSHGLPFGNGLAWLIMAAMLACSLGLLVRRLIRPAAIGAIALLAGGIVLFYGRHWFVVGGDAVDGEPGIELNLLLIACLVATLWTYWPRVDEAARARAATVGIEIIRVSSALVLVPHGMTALLTWDVEGMRQWGEAMEHRGFPCGVALVWSLKGLEATSAFARLSRRLMVPACLGNMLVIVPGMWIAHGLKWWVLGPGEDGIEYSVLLVTCAVACILAYWPVRSPALGPTDDARLPV